MQPMRRSLKIYLGITTLPYLQLLLILNSRFLLNLPEEELSSLERICFQVEQA
jgi:hypothetical protein